MCTSHPKKCEGRTGHSRTTPAVGIARRRPSQDDALKYKWAFGWNATDNTRDCKAVQFGRHSWSRSNAPRSHRARFDGFMPVNRVRSNPKKWGSRPCGTPYRWDPTLALVVRCHPIARRTPNSDHAMRHIFGDQSSHEDCSRQPPRLLGVDTFRLILPEDIAIGIRFSHASCTNLDS